MSSCYYKDEKIQRNNISDTTLKKQNMKYIGLVLENGVEVLIYHDHIEVVDADDNCVANIPIEDLLSEIIKLRGEGR